MSLSAAIDRLTVALTPLVEAGDSVAFSPLCFLHALMLLAFVSDSPAALALRRELALPDLQDAARLLLAGVDDAAVAAAAAVFARDVKAGAPAPPAVKALHGDVQHLESGMQVNAFVKHATHGEITQIVSDTLGEDVRTVILSTLYFHGKWAKSFVVGDYPYPWHKFGGAEAGKAQYMSQTFKMGDGALYGAAQGWSAALLTYKESDVRALFMLPEKSTPAALAATLGELAASPAAVLTKLGTSSSLKVASPRFRIEQELDGLRQVAGPAGFLDRISGPKFEVLGQQLGVSAVVHKCVIDVDEFGTTAAAATGIMMPTAIMIPQKPDQLILDRPFVFGLIRNETLLFVSSVTEPTLIDE